MSRSGFPTARATRSRASIQRQYMSWSTSTLERARVLWARRRVRKCVGSELWRSVSIPYRSQNRQSYPTMPIGIGDSEGGIAAGAGSIWLMTDKKGTLARLDPADNKVVAEIQLPPGSFTVAFGEGAVWVTRTETNVLSRVDPNRNVVVETIPVGKTPRFLTVGGGFVWTLNQAEGNLSKVDVKTNKVVATIELGVPGGGGEISFGEGSVWVTTSEFGLTGWIPKPTRSLRAIQRRWR